MAGTIVTDRIESDASYASSVNIASPLVIANTISMTNGAITGNLNIDSNTVFVNQVNNRVGIGTGTPLEVLHVNGAVHSTLNALDFNQTGAHFDYNLGTARISSYRSTGSTIEFLTNPSGSTTRPQATISPTGIFTTPYQPAFRARKTSTQTIQNNTADIKVTYDTADTNIGSHYNTTTSRFTAPVTGWYHFNAFFMYNSFPNDWSYSFIRFLFNGSSSNTEMMYNRITSGQQFLTLQASTYYYMSANDYVEVYARLVGGSSNAQIRDSFAEFQGMFIG